MGDWISVEIKKPDQTQREEGDFLVWMQKFGDPNRGIGFHLLACFDNNNRWRDDHGRDIEDNSDYYYVTHWMPLPESPFI